MKPKGIQEAKCSDCCLCWIEMMKMNCFVTVGVLILLVNGINGQCEIKDDNGGPLQLDKFTPQSLGKFPKTVKDGEELPGIHMQGVEFFSVTENNCGNFLDIMNNETIVYATAKNFANWDNAGNPNGQCTFFITFNANDIACNFSSIRVNFTYTVEDVNTKPPEFNQLSYSFNVPLPLPPGLDLTGALGVLIQTVDQDFSTKNVAYTLDGDNADYFETRSSASSNKVFPMSLLTKKLINTQKDINLLVTATDDGTPSLNSTAEITITFDLENSIPPSPEFTQHLTTGKIDPSTINPGDEVIQVELQEAFDDVTITVSPGFFEAVMDPNGKIVHIKLKTQLDAETATFMTIEVQSTITYGSNTASSATIVVLEFSNVQTTSTESTTTDTNTTEWTGTPTDTTTTTEWTGTPTDTTTTTEWTGTPTDTTTTTEWTGTPTDTTTTEGTGTPNGTTTTTTQQTTSTPPEGEPEDTDSGLLAATIIFSISTAVLLILNGYGFYKYIYLPRKARKSAIA